MMTTLGVLCRTLVAVALLLLAASAANAADSPPPPPDAGVAKARALFEGGKFEEALAVLRPLAVQAPDRADILFLIGLAAIEYSQRPNTTEAERDERLDEAIASLRAMLIDRPELVRAHLELARAFFLKGEDNLARGHFERVLAGKPPAQVAANVRRFLREIRARRRWTMHVGAAVAPDSNIGAASDERIIYINDLPFRRDADELTTSGVGVSVWAGGEYQHPLGERLRLRLGGDIARQEHAGREFDQTFLSGHAGPRWLAGKGTDISVLASARRRWVGGETDYDDVGVRGEAGHRFSPRVAANARASWHHRQYQRREFLDGPVLDASLGGTWVILPTVRAEAAVGYARERPEARVWRSDGRWVRAGVSVALPRGFTVGGSGELRWTDYEGNWFPFTRDGAPREDRTRTLSVSVYNRAFTLFGFSPQLVVTHEVRESNAQLHDYERTRGELRFVRQF